MDAQPRAAVHVRHGRRGGSRREHQSEDIRVARVGGERDERAGGNLVGGDGPPAARRPRVVRHADAVVHEQAPGGGAVRWNDAGDDLDVLGRERRPLNLDRGRLAGGGTPLRLERPSGPFPHRQDGGGQRWVRDGAEPRDAFGVHLTGEAPRRDEAVADHSAVGQRRRSSEGDKSGEGGDAPGRRRASHRPLPPAPRRVDHPRDAPYPRARSVPASNDRAVRSVRDERRRVRRENEDDAHKRGRREPSSHARRQRLGPLRTLGQGVPIEPSRPRGERRQKPVHPDTSHPGTPGLRRLDRRRAVEEAPSSLPPRRPPPLTQRPRGDPRGERHVDEAHQRADHDRQHVPQPGSRDVRTVPEPFIRG